jgi:peptidase E
VVTFWANTLAFHPVVPFLPSTADQVKLRNTALFVPTAPCRSAHQTNQHNMLMHLRSALWPSPPHPR